MTEQEVEAFLARLARIWEGVSVYDGLLQFEVHGVWKEPHLELRTGFWRRFHSASLSDSWSRLIIVTFSPGFYLEIDPNRTHGEDPSSLAQLVRLELESRREQFGREHQERFRACAWLSGCDIEASAHEKAEWIQGFSREELEAWNLKI